MIAVDTNLVVRLFVDDEQSREQALLVRDFLRYHDCIYIGQIVQIELVWVLESCYHFDKETIIKILQIMYERNDFALQNPQQFHQALQYFKTGNADFSDYLIVADSQKNGLQFFTFDKKLSKAEAAIRLTQQVVDEIAK